LSSDSSTSRLNESWAQSAHQHAQFSLQQFCSAVYWVDQRMVMEIARKATDQRNPCRKFLATPVYRRSPAWELIVFGAD